MSLFWAERLFQKQPDIFELRKRLIKIQNVSISILTGNFQNPLHFS
jgi:hypothetical protein